MQKKDMTDHDKMELISRVELFSTLLADDLSYVSSRSGFRAVPEGTMLFSAGETATQFFIVKKGSVSIATTTQSGEHELARYMPGDVIGDFHFVINGRYDATARTLEKTELFVFPEDGLTFDRISEEKPDTAARLLLKSITMIESRIRSTERLAEENEPWIRELRKQSFTDPATGLWNRTFLDSELPRQLSGTVTVLMVKPDNFKEINDILGHVQGDEILKDIAALLIEMTDRGGWAIRLRSNEMCLVMPGTDANGGWKVAREIQSALPGIVPRAETLIPFILTASMALGVWPSDDENWQAVMDRTNQVMQDVWRSGGNKIAFLREETGEKI
jgi:diguanylate cyclase (GGDEF)-like protein